jgi:hypothetical protein
VGTALVVAATAHAQTLADRVARVDGNAEILFASRPGVCGDGRGSFNNLLGNHARQHGDGYTCVHGPVRVVATVVGGEVTRLKAYVGPIPAPRVDVTSLGTVPTSDAIAWLSNLVTRGNSRLGQEAIVPLVAAEGSNPWPLLLRVARDDARPRELRRQALFWLGQGVNDHLGIDDDARSDDDEMKSQAVFAISQQPREWSTPRLIEVARTSKNPVVRSQAIFWLGQTGDPRIADLFAELLGLR